MSALKRLEVEAWHPGRNDAACVYVGRSRGPHASPDLRCDCGLHAYHDISAMARAAGADGCIGGAVVAWGDMEVHVDGFRAQYAQVVALAVPDTARLAVPAKEAARRYAVPLVALAELQDRAAVHGEPLPVSVRPARWPRLRVSSNGVSSSDKGLQLFAVWRGRRLRGHLNK